MKTVKLYESNPYVGDPYIKEFEARVVALLEQNGVKKVVLDRTAFYPEGGGQPYDLGYIDDCQVTAVHEEEDIIYHTVDKLPSEGVLIKGRIDWKRRYNLMQNHSGEHIVSGIIHRENGYDNVGFHMGAGFMTLDLNGELTDQQLQRIEDMANEAIYKNVDIKVQYPTNGELLQIDYRSKKAIAGQVRLIDIEGYDMCACCGTHVRTTSEIGLIKLLSVQKYKSGVRIVMKAGMDALADYQMKHTNTTQISRILSAKVEEIAQAVDKLLSDYNELKYEVMQKKKALIAYKAAAVTADRQLLFIREKDMEMAELREYANLLLDKAEVVMIVSEKTAEKGDGAFSDDKTGEISYILGSKTHDMREISKALNQQFNGKGGGSVQMVQGVLNTSLDTVEGYFLKIIV